MALNSIVCIVSVPNIQTTLEDLASKAFIVFLVLYCMGGLLSSYYQSSAVLVAAARVQHYDQVLWSDNGQAACKEFPMSVTKHEVELQKIPSEIIPMVES